MVFTALSCPYYPNYNNAGLEIELIWYFSIFKFDFNLQVHSYYFLLLDLKHHNLYFHSVLQKRCVCRLCRVLYLRFMILLIATTDWKYHQTFVLFSLIFEMVAMYRDIGDGWVRWLIATYLFADHLNQRGMIVPPTISLAHTTLGYFLHYCTDELVAKLGELMNLHCLPDIFKECLFIVFFDNK